MRLTGGGEHVFGDEAETVDDTHYGVDVRSQAESRPGYDQAPVALASRSCTVCCYSCCRPFLHVRSTLTKHL